MGDGVITAIEPVRHGSRARVLWVDGEPWRTTSRSVVQALEVAEGDDIVLAELATRLESAELACAKERALASIARAETSSARLADKLLADGYDASVVRTVVDDAVHAGYVDDSRYARIVARDLAECRRYGRRRVADALFARGIGPDVATPVLDEFCPEDGEAQRADDAALKALPGARGSARRLTDRLIRRGFSPRVALDASRKALADAADDLPDLDA